MAEKQTLKSYLAASATVSDAFSRFFSDCASNGGVAVIPQGNYELEGTVTLPCALHVVAHGAHFWFPRTLREPHAVMFRATNARGLLWEGGTFHGYVYDPCRTDNAWEPFYESVAIHALGGRDITVRDAAAENLAGSLILVEGEPSLPVENVSILRLRSQNSGRFMWDYGYLWQRITFPWLHTAEEVENAYRYMPREYYSDTVSVRDGRLYSDFLPSRDERDDAVSFFGDEIPAPLVRGRYYYASEAPDGGIAVSEGKDIPPICVEDGVYRARFFRGLYRSYHMMYAPYGTGRSKGGVDVRHCLYFNVEGCQISAPGDATHLHGCCDGRVTGNHICGARMGAMFLSMGCRDVCVEGNTVEGGNCSRILTVESGGTNITVRNNVFTGGGRGTWIDTPSGLVIENNVFSQNTGKCLPDVMRGRLSPTRGEFERYCECYVTTRRPDAVWRDVVIRGNIFHTGAGATATLAFLSNGKGARVEGNLFSGTTRGVYIAQTCKDVVLSDNGDEIPLLDTLVEEAFDIPGKIYW